MTEQFRVHLEGSSTLQRKTLNITSFNLQWQQQLTHLLPERHIRRLQSDDIKVKQALKCSDLA